MISPKVRKMDRMSSTLCLSAGRGGHALTKLGTKHLFFPAKQAAVHMTESGSPSRWARAALSAAGSGSGQRAQRAPTRGPSQVRRQRRLWRPATALPGPCRQRRAALQSTARPGGSSSEGLWRTESPDELSDSRTSACESAFQRPPTSTARTKRRWPPPRCNSG